MCSQTNQLWFEIDYDGVNWEGIIKNTVSIGLPADKMANETVITHYIFDHAPKLASEIIPMIIEEAQDDPRNAEGENLLDRCIYFDKFDLARNISKIIDMQLCLATFQLLPVCISLHKLQTSTKCF